MTIVPRFRPGKRARNLLPCRFVSDPDEICVTSCEGYGTYSGVWITDKAHFQELVQVISRLASLAS